MGLYAEQGLMLVLAVKIHQQVADGFQGPRSNGPIISETLASSPCCHLSTQNEFIVYIHPQLFQGLYHPLIVT